MMEESYDRRLTSSLTMPPSMHDELPSGYPPLFLDALQKIIEERNKHLGAALLLISINNMPMMISGFGHKATEEAVRALLFSIKHFLGADDSRQMITRVQKDQVCVVLHHYDIHNFEHLADAIARHIKSFGYKSEYGNIHVLSSVVSVALPTDSLLAEELMNRAYIAAHNTLDVLHTEENPVKMEEAKASSRYEMNMVNYITHAIKDGQLILAFQPVIHSHTGATSYYEALLRIQKESGELTSAGPLIPVAERMGLIDIIDEIVLEKIVEELIRYPELRLSFNVSNLTANSNAWLKRFKHLAGQYPDVIERMIIEITETAVHLDMSRTAYFVAEVQAGGARVALDDFGSGYTSFRQLKSLSVDIIKIDGVFIRDLVDNHDNHLFIKTMLDFTNGFGLDTVAEFVENGETAKILMALGVQYMQGYYFGYPQTKQLWL
ncbi:MAG: EAL domain-containing protein [Alphaproteobacteria bacterium]|nr:MAG: EAL domain-containing protein [Alphaproteobacteria bacterium]